MAQFNPADYETVASRITRFYEAYPTGRIITENLTTENDRAQSIWIVRASVYLTLEEQIAGCPKATGLAFEVDGLGMANKTAALENAETSSIGRCLANMGMSGDKRASREEMEKAQRGVTPGAVATPKADLSGIEKQIADVKTLDELQSLWESLSKDGLGNEVRPLFTARKTALSAS
jgi:hypothetical protein